MIRWLLHVLALLPLTCQGRFLEQPTVRWTFRVPGSGSLSGRGFRSGNQVVASPDGKTLFATADDGTLHLIDTEDLRNSQVFDPETIAGTFTECRSGVTLKYDANNKELAYVVYSVIDVPVQVGVLYDGLSSDSSRSSTLSRLLAVNLDGTLRWSVPLNGAVVGNAVVGGTQNDKLFVAHNVPNFIGASPTRGKVSVVLLKGSRPTVTASVSPLNRHGPFGPPSAATVTTTTGTTMEVVVVAEAWEKGYSSDTGSVFLLKPSALYREFDGQGNDAYQLDLISDWAVGSVTKPVVKSFDDNSALEVFAGAAGARLSGWTGANTLAGVIDGSQEDVKSSWDVTLQTNKGNASQPLLVAPVLSKDQTVLYQSGASTELYCIGTENGEILWTSSGNNRGSIRAEPRLVDNPQDDPKVFVIEGSKGKVRQHDASSGVIDWTFDCHDVSGIPCHDAVEADFSIDPSGNTLFYGDVFGKIVALQIATFTSQAPQAAPTDPPVTAVPINPEEPDPEEVTPGPTTPLATPAPTPDPTQSPVATPTNTPNPTQSPVVAPTTPPVEKTPTPTWTPVTSPVDVYIPYEIPGSDAPDDVGFEDTSQSASQAQDTSSNSEFSSSAAINGEDEPDSFFSNDIMIILVAVCGGLALAIIVLLIAQKVRSSKRTKALPSHDLISEEQDGKDWSNAQDEYEEHCRRNEEETLREIESTAPSTPSQGSKRPSKKPKKSPVTPTTLASIEESPAENDTSFVSDATPKNLVKSFDASMMEETSIRGRGLEVSLADAPLPNKTADDAIAQQKSTTSVASTDNSKTAGISSVEVVANLGNKPPKVMSRVRSPAVVPSSPDHGGNDLMSVDGSLYLDDDSYLQGSKVEVASLSQFSAASTQEGGSDIGTHYTTDENGLRFEAAYEKPRVASPIMSRTLSPQVEDYLRRNTSFGSSSNPPVTPGAYLQAKPTGTMSPSPVTPPSEANSPEPDGGIDKDVARAGHSVRPGSGQGRGRQEEPSDEESSGIRSRSPSIPRPPVEAEANDEPEDAWNSFLFELAKAEREFFNPSFGKKKKEAKRSESPPPPPPPPHSPPESPARGQLDPPTRRQLL
ncbi:expressed unknown protein [Seminavis robusta]|uniref:Pyrrolo-quinoline quinone repeat domain-containing protein n=1 Tax=Seminavis robusta TaxID=568900 RepID=A0A9N8E7F9_9STRA|nr:expressed unknown protein [Seminavis robusta]|eukprot:Sro764_g199010.1 n/a (1087) ;mRNA; r:4666-8150